MRRAGLLGDPLGEVMLGFADCVDDARQPVDPGLVSAAVDRAVREGMRGVSRRALFAAVTPIVLLALISGAGGWMLGRHSASVDVASTEAGVQAAFRDGPLSAAMWLQWMRNNDARQVGKACAQTTVTVNGQHACAVGFWLDQAPPPSITTK